MASRHGQPTRRSVFIYTTPMASFRSVCLCESPHTALHSCSATEKRESTRPASTSRSEAKPSPPTNKSARKGLWFGSRVQGQAPHLRLPFQGSPPRRPHLKIGLRAISKSFLSCRSQMKRQSKQRLTSSRESTGTGEDLAFAEEENLTARNMEREETEMEDVDEDDDEPARGRSTCGLGEKKRRLAQEQVRALERCFETDNKLDPDRKACIARDLGLQPRQVAVWFQNRRARWKTKHLERDFAALRARHDALRADCDALRRDKDALAAEIRELRQKLSNPEPTVKVEATGNDAAEDRQGTVGASATAVYKDGSSDSDSSVVFNDVEASRYSGAVFEQPPQSGGFVGFGGSLIDSAAATMACSFLPPFGTNWHHGSATYPCHPYKGGGDSFGFTEEWLAGSDVISSDGVAGFFADDHASSFNFS